MGGAGAPYGATLRPWRPGGQAFHGELAHDAMCCCLDWARITRLPRMIDPSATNVNIRRSTSTPTSDFLMSG